MTGTQAAMVFAPDDEPALEIQLAAPRSILWLVGERLAVVLLVQGSIALVATMLSLNFVPQQNLLLAVMRWAAPMVFLCGVGLYVTIRTRVPLFGILIVSLLWFGFSMFGGFFVPGAAFGGPFNVIQPFLWTLHPYLEPTDIGITYYWLNRFSVITAGLALLTLAARILRHPELILMGRRQRTSKRPIAFAAQQFMLSGSG